MIAKASMFLLAAFSLVPALAVPSQIRLEPVSAINKGDNDFTSISSVKINAKCQGQPYTEPGTMFEADSFRRGAPEWCTEMKDDLRKEGMGQQMRMGNMSDIGGEKIEHDVEREFDIFMDIIYGRKYVGKHDEAVCGFCVRTLQNYGSKELGCTKVKGATVVQGGVASSEYENMVVKAVELVDW